jgi:hypothetical protein
MNASMFAGSDITPIQPAVRLLHGLDSAPSMSGQIIKFWLTEFYSFDTVATNTTHGE